MRQRARAARTNLGFLLAKALQRWNERLYEGFVAEGFGDVRPAYGSILLPLFEEDGLRMGALAQRARLSKQTMTTMVAVMEKRGLVERRKDPEDARAWRIYLSARSRRFRAAVERVLARLEAEAKRSLGPRRLRTLGDALRILMELGARSQRDA